MVTYEDNCGKKFNLANTLIKEDYRLWLQPKNNIFKVHPVKTS